MGIDKTISKLLSNLKNILIGFYFKVCVLEWYHTIPYQWYVHLGCSGGALGAICEGEAWPGRVRAHCYSFRQSGSNLVFFTHQSSLGSFCI